jgi:hypothetical protein
MKSKHGDILDLEKDIVLMSSKAFRVLGDIAVFIFDNSGHACKAKDALQSQKTTCDAQHEMQSIRTSNSGEGKQNYMELS